MQRLNIYVEKLLLWRIRHISDKNFLLILSIVVGISVGLAAVIMKNSVYFVREIAEALVAEYSFSYLYIIFPAIGIFLTLIFIHYILKRTLGHGIPMVLRSISTNEAKIPAHNMFSRIIASSLTVGFGGSVGLEGPIVATGAAIGSNLGQFFKLNYKQLVLLIGCACTGAIAAIFKAPVAAIVFTIEVIMLDLTMGSLLPLLLASISAALTSYLFLGQNYIYSINIEKIFLLSDVPFYIVLGILSGFLSLYFSKIYLWQNKIYQKQKNKFIRFIIGSFILGALVFVFPSLYGEGYEVVNTALKGSTDFLFNNTLYNTSNNPWIIALIILLILLLKTFATGATFGAGGVGGIFAPSIFLGALLGLGFSEIAHVFNFNIAASNFALTGMAGLMAGIMHAPLTAIFMVAEVTGGYSLFVPLMIVAATSFFIVKIFMPNSVYTIMLAQRGELITHNTDSNMLTLMKVDNLIETNFSTISENATLRELTKTISLSNRNIFVVVDDKNYLKGLVSLDHIRHLMFKQEFYDNVYVKDLMYIPDKVIDIEMPVRNIIKIFEVTEHYNLPIVDKGKYLGFISRARIFTEYREMIKDFSND